MTRINELEHKALTEGLTQDEADELTDLVRDRIVQERESRGQRQ
jgi:uncharacterized protein YnzC (UPF0291/DUF896 family)